MKKVTDIILISIIATLAFISCEDNTLEIQGLSPKIKAKFINNDSLQGVLLTIQANNQELTNVRDSITELDALIAGGDQTDYAANFESLNTQEDSLLDVRQFLNQLRNVILNGEIYIQKIAGTGGDGEVIYEIGDSLQVFDLPLNINSSNSEFLITIEDTEYGIAFTYDRDTVVKEGSVVIEANNIKLLNFSGLDSVSFPCDTLNCKSFEARATLYF